MIVLDHNQISFGPGGGSNTITLYVAGTRIAETATNQAFELALRFLSAIVITGQATEETIAAAINKRLGEVLAEAGVIDPEPSH